MKIELKGHNYYYEVCQEAKQFFLLEKFEQASISKEDQNYIISQLQKDKSHKEKDRYFIKTVVCLYGKPSETRHFITIPKVSEGEKTKEDLVDHNLEAESYGDDEIEENYEDNFQIIHQIRLEIKRSLYLTLIKATGRKLLWGSLCGVRPARRALLMLQNGSSKEQIREEFKNYFVSKEKTELVLQVARAEQKILYQNSHLGISLYIAIPFCPSRCLYCSFYSSKIPKESKPIADYLFALIKEMRAVQSILMQTGKFVETIYIGGGTPTSLPKDCLDFLLSNVEEIFELSSLVEYTVECGRPDTIDREKLRILKKHQVSRISINPQSMNQSTLELLGRNHTPLDIVECFKLANDEGFFDINCDIIAGIPKENKEMFLKSLEEVLKLNPSNITVHTLSIKRSSLLYEKIQDYDLPTAQTVNQMISSAYHTLKEHNYFPYYLYRQKNMLGNLENVGYAKTGSECLYNVIMMEELKSVIGLGAGSVTKRVLPDGLKIQRVFNVKNAGDYVARIDEMIERKRSVLLNNI